MRPLPLDILEFFLPLLCGTGLFFLGWTFARWPALLRHVTVTLVVGGVIFIAVCLLRLIPFAIDPVLYSLGGPKLVLSLVALLLLGIAWKAPGRTFTPSFLYFLVAVAGFILTIDVSGRLMWRFFSTDAWSRFPDAAGCLTQSTTRTCGPTAAAMLLHHYGIEASEGEIAYLARTSLFGSDAFALSRAVHDKVQGRNLSAVFRKTDYAGLLAKPRPFVATLRFRNLVAHAIYVERLDAEDVDIVDPSKGYRTRISRAEFESEWNGEIVTVTDK